jgi:hypothetical protein
LMVAVLGEIVIEARPPPVTLKELLVAPVRPLLEAASV